MKQAYILEDSGEAQRLEKQSSTPAYLLKNDLQFIQIENNHTILDAGCGTGLVSRYLSNINKTIKLNACDFSELRVQQAKKMSKNVNPNIHFFTSNLNNINLPDNTFDYIICRYVYEYLPDHDEVTKEFYRIAKKKGVVYLVDVDGVFANLSTRNKRLNYLLEKTIKNMEIDLLAGRKLPTTLFNSNFHHIKWHVEVNKFTGEDLITEHKNTKDRLKFARPTLKNILGNNQVADEFCELYLHEMLKEENTLFQNKFIAWGTK